MEILNELKKMTENDIFKFVENLQYFSQKAVIIWKATIIAIIASELCHNSMIQLCMSGQLTLMKFVKFFPQINTICYQPTKKKVSSTTYKILNVQRKL